MGTELATGSMAIVADDELEIGSIRAERNTSRRTDRRARLPPAVLTADDVRLERILHGGTRADLPLGVSICTPIARLEAASGCGRRMHLRHGGPRATSMAEKAPSPPAN